MAPSLESFLTERSTAGTIYLQTVQLCPEVILMTGWIAGIACVSMFLPTAISTLAKPLPEVSMRTLIDFDGDPTEPRWVAVNDGVMGGRSSGAPTVKDGMLEFSGTLSLDNNGGFSSVRTVDYAVDLSNAKAVVLRIRGDGRRYQLRLATNAQHRGITVSYAADFVSPAGVWTEVRLSLDSLQPSVRGTRLKGPLFDSSQVKELGLLISDKQEGSFALAVDWVAVE